VLAQSCSPIEIIVVDDGSTDGTADVAGRYVRYITYAHQNNAGPASARNHGISRSSGELVTFPGFGRSVASGQDGHSARAFRGAGGARCVHSAHAEFLVCRSGTRGCNPRDGRLTQVQPKSGIVVHGKADAVRGGRSARYRVQTSGYTGTHYARRGWRLGHGVLTRRTREASHFTMPISAGIDRMQVISSCWRSRAAECCVAASFTHDSD